jgi:hypothetical protein
VGVPNADDRFYDAEGYAITIGGERYGPISPLRDELAALKARFATPYSFAFNDAATLEKRALELACSMASVKCKNKYPVGVIGAEARAHYTEARRIAAKATPTRSAKTTQIGLVRRMVARCRKAFAR